MSRTVNYFEKSISASAINTYLRCPLDFYYRYIAELGEEQNVEEGIESQQFGSLVHQALEILYQPFAQFDADGKEIDPKPEALEQKDIQRMLKVYKQVLYEQFYNYFDQDDQLFLKGKNLVSYTIAQDTVENTLRKELDFLNSLNEDLFIVQVEAKQMMELELTVHGQKRKISFYRIYRQN